MATESLRDAERDPFALAAGDRDTVEPALRVMERAWFDVRPHSRSTRTSRPPPRPSAPPIGDSFADDWFR